MLKTEMRNPLTMNFDKMSTEEMVSVMTLENANAVRAVEAASGSIAKAIDTVAEAFSNGNRLFFIGAGTSGRLGVLDASECPPTFGVSPDMVQGIIAGGKECMFRAAENAEDLSINGRDDVISYGIRAGDVLIGISVAGNAAYVREALRTAKELGAHTVALTCNDKAQISEFADISIVTDTGAEVLTGSTRLKAGTAHKMVLNMITTCAMTKIGNVYENLMINLRPTNDKLRDRTIRIVQEILGCERDEAIEKLENNEWNIRRAVSK
ncbi:MAG: N-acetylmuramic acid 6-phosphate etherase [Clostridia bacterium]|nr:N-acetylmuramic acid 6-phosphate etherase [Clostridia bacterium]